MVMVMGRQGLSGYGYLLKPRNLQLLITLAFVAVLVLGIYYQVVPDYYDLAPVIHRLLQNHHLPINPREDIPNPDGDKYDQLAASLQSLILAVRRFPDGTLEHELAQKELDQELAHRRHVDCAIEQIAKAFYSPDDFSWLIDTFPHRLDDWDCFKTLISTYKTYCGGLSYYGTKYSNVFANMCNNGTQGAQLAEIASQVCGDAGKC